MQDCLEKGEENCTATNLDGLLQNLFATPFAETLDTATISIGCDQNSRVQISSSAVF